MRLSQSFVKSSRETPKDEAARSAQFLLQAGYLHKELAGVYTYLPLGLRVLRKIEDVIRQELDAIGCQEISMTALQNPSPWQITGRWDSHRMDIWFKTALAAGGELGLAPTHEEPITNMMRKFITSYKDLPCYVYQFQTKFRNELRAKSGIMRTREFLMKDLYSFSTDLESHQRFYAQVEAAYHRIFDRIGISTDTYEAFASGGVFSRYSHEFQTLLPVGEDTIYFNQDKSVVLNQEVLEDSVLADLKVRRDQLQSAKAAEVGNIFTLSYKFSEPLGLNFNNQNGQRQTVFMGSYGIGVSRLMGVIAEKFTDDKGLIWPKAVAPFQYYLIAIGEQATARATELYQSHPDIFLYDDRGLRPGAKFTDADLLGIPYRLVISDQTLANQQVELTQRSNGQQTLLTIDHFASKI